MRMRCCNLNERSFFPHVEQSHAQLAQKPPSANGKFHHRRSTEIANRSRKKARRNEMPVAEARDFGFGKFRDRGSTFTDSILWTRLPVGAFLRYVNGYCSSFCCCPRVSRDAATLGGDLQDPRPSRIRGTSRDPRSCRAAVAFAPNSAGSPRRVVAGDQRENSVDIAFASSQLPESDGHC